MYNSQTLNIIYLSNGIKTFDECLNFFIPSPLRNASPGVSFLRAPSMGAI